MKRYSKKSRAFGLIEVLVACGLLVMVSAATTVLGVMSLHSSVISKHRTEAYMLAQDVVEQVKGSREWTYQNWSESGSQAYTWNSFWATSTFGFQNIRTDINTNYQYVCINHSGGGRGAVVTTSASPCATGTLQFTRLLSDKTDVSELLGFTANSGKAYKIIATVSWNDYGQTQSVQVSSYLTDYKARN